MEESGTLFGVFTAVRDMLAGNATPPEYPSESPTTAPGEQVVDAGRLTAAAPMQGVRSDDKSVVDSRPRRGRGRAASGRQDEQRRMLRSDGQRMEWVDRTGPPRVQSGQPRTLSSTKVRGPASAADSADNQFENEEDQEIDLSAKAARDRELARTGSPEKGDGILPSPTTVDESVKSSLRAPSANGEEETKVLSTNPQDGKGDQAEQRKRAVGPVKDETTERSTKSEIDRKRTRFTGT
jgi:hypothetical protein